MARHSQCNADRRPPQVNVVGLGPAGAALAIGLAREGIDVRIYDGGIPAGGHEGLSQRTVELIAAAGLTAAADVLPTLAPRIGLWGDRSVQGHEVVVERTTLHAALRHDVRRAGVRIETERRLSLGHSQTDALTIRATGRRGAALSGPRLLAVAYTVQTEDREAGTEVGAWSQGWYWISNNGQRTQLQVVMRPKDFLRTSWKSNLAKEVPHLATALNHLRPDFIARSAHARYAKMDDPLAVVGDAAIAIDPLSGNGVYEALRSALMHVSAAKTYLAGGDVEAVRQFLTDRRAEMWERTTRTAASFYIECRTVGAFWRHCSDEYAALSRTNVPVVTQSHIETRAVLNDGFISSRPVVVTPSMPRGAWQVGGVPLVELHEFLNTCAIAPDALSQATRRFGRTETEIRAAAHWLRASGLPERNPCQ